jgi:hypothetical protein
MNKKYTFSNLIESVGTIFFVAVFIWIIYTIGKSLYFGLWSTILILLCSPFLVYSGTKTRIWISYVFVAVATWCGISILGSNGRFETKLKSAVFNGAKKQHKRLIPEYTDDGIIYPEQYETDYYFEPSDKDSKFLLESIELLVNFVPGFILITNLLILIKRFSQLP